MAKVKVNLLTGGVYVFPDDENTGADGLDNYQLALIEGFVGSRAEYLESIKGDNGLSNYQIAVNNGFVGTELEWLDSIKGADGEPGQPGNDGQDGEPGPQGPAGNEVGLASDPIPFIKATTLSFADLLTNAIVSLNTKNYGGRNVLILFADGTHNMGNDIFEIVGLYGGRLILEAENAIYAPGSNQLATVNLNGLGYIKALNCHINLDVRMLKFNVNAGQHLIPFNIDGHTNVVAYYCCFDLRNADAESTAFFLAGAKLTGYGNTLIGSPTQITNFVKFARGGEDAQGGEVQLFNTRYEVTPFTNAINGNGAGEFSDSDTAYVRRVINGSIDRSFNPSWQQIIDGIDSVQGTYWRLGGGGALPQLTAPVLSIGTVTETSIEVLISDPNTSPNETSRELYISSNGTDGWILESTLSSDVVSRVVTLNSGVHRYFRLRDIGDGVNATTSDFSNVVDDTTNVVSVVAPTVTTQAVTGETDTTATGNGNITNDGGASITAHGIVYVEGTGTPTLADTVVDNGAGAVGAFTAAITGLAEETLYTMRAFATNSEGTSYGGDVTFTTAAASGPVVLPTVMTHPQLLATWLDTSIVARGNISNLGGASNSAHGFVYGTNPNPTLSDGVLNLGIQSTVGDYTGNITGLNAETLYYVRSYSTNSAGTAYGDDVQITTGTVGTVALNPISNVVSTPEAYAVDLSWTDNNTSPNDGGTTIYKRIAGSADWVYTTYAGSNAETARLDSLTSNTNYELLLVTLAPAGFGKRVSDIHSFTTGAYVDVPPVVGAIYMVGTFEVGRPISGRYYYNDPEPESGTLFELKRYANQAAADLDTDNTAGVSLASGTAERADQHIDNLNYIIQGSDLGEVFLLWIRPNSTTLQGAWTKSAVSPVIAAYVESAEMLINGDFADATGWETTGGVTIGSGVATFDNSASSNLIRRPANMVAPLEINKIYELSVLVSGADATGLRFSISTSGGTNMKLTTTYQNGVNTIEFKSPPYMTEGGLQLGFVINEIGGNIDDLSLKIK